MICPLMNPIRFISGLANYNTSFPHFDNTTQRELWVPGINPAMWYKEWLAGKQINLQFEVEPGDATNLIVLKYSETSEKYDVVSTLTPTNITPNIVTGKQIS